MASWKKVIVSGSVAELSAVSASSYYVLGLSTKQVLDTPVATVISGSFSGSFTGTATSASLPILGLITASVNSSTITFTKGNGTTFDIVVAQGVASSTATITMNNTGSGLWYPTFVASGSNSQSLYVNSSSFNYNAATNTLSTTSSYASQLVNPLFFGVGLTGSTSTYNGAIAVTASVSGASSLTSSYHTKWTGTAFASSLISETAAQITLATGSTISAGGLTVTGNSTFNNNLTVAGDLSVNGTTTFINTTNTYIKDQLILLNSGSNTLSDGGIVVQYNTGSGAGPIGSALFLESAAAGTYGRWAIAFGVTGSQTSIAANEYMVSVLVSASAAFPTSPTWGGATNGLGNMYINSNNGDIYIYS